MEQGHAWFEAVGEPVLAIPSETAETQFVRMIKSQKGYQASARVVSGADDMLQELMQLV